MKQLLYILLLLPLSCFAQYTPLQSQYMFNNVAMNPAATGSGNALTLVGSFRAQWVGFPGAPTTQAFTAHAPLKREKSAIGVQVYADQIGVMRNTGIYGLYSYRLKLERSNLRFGASAGINLISEDLGSLDVEHSNDPSLAPGRTSGVLPNFSVGAHWSSDKSFLSFSIPFLLTHSFSNSSYILATDFSNVNYLLGGGYEFDLKNNFAIKPSVLLKFRSGTRPQLDVNARFRCNDYLDLGISYRTEEALMVLSEIRINKQLHFMYSFGFPLNPLAQYSFGSHELSLKYRFRYKINSSNPRYLAW
jgi:type IX secretion system PorP/SprF family membrane protein